MARPCKPAGAQSEFTSVNQRKRVEQRLEAERKIGGGKVKLTPEKWLTDMQKKYFRSAVKYLENADVLRAADVHILSEWAWALDMKVQAEIEVNNNPRLKYDKDVLSALDKYTKTFFRCCNELGFSPQARAKVAANIVKADDGAELLKQILAGEEEEEL